MNLSKSPSSVMTSIKPIHQWRTWQQSHVYVRGSCTCFPKSTLKLYENSNCNGFRPNFTGKRNNTSWPAPGHWKFTRWCLIMNFWCPNWRVSSSCITQPVYMCTCALLMCRETHWYLYNSPYIKKWVCVYVCVCACVCDGAKGEMSCGYVEPEAAQLNGSNSSTAKACCTWQKNLKLWHWAISYSRVGDQYQYVMIYLLKTSILSFPTGKVAKQNKK